MWETRGRERDMEDIVRNIESVFEESEIVGSRQRVNRQSVLGDREKDKRQTERHRYRVRLKRGGTERRRRRFRTDTAI
jgi:hypothetical protein